MNVHFYVSSSRIYTVLSTVVLYLVWHSSHPYMRRRRLGRTGLEVSEISLGTVELGLRYGIGAPDLTEIPSEKDATTLLNAALDLGVNFLDTARSYGTSERVIGKALKNRRHEYILVSKIEPQPQKPNRVRELVDESLRDLQSDYIDIVMIHAGEESAPCQVTANALHDLRKDGKLRFVGYSGYGCKSAQVAIESGQFDCLQIAYSVMDRRPEKTLLEAARQNDIGIVARSVLLKGALTSRYQWLPAEAEPIRRSVKQLVQTIGSIDALPEFAYRYVLSHEPPHSALIGTAHLSELRQCVNYLTGGSLPDAIQEAIVTIPPIDDYWLNPGNWRFST